MTTKGSVPRRAGFVVRRVALASAVCACTTGFAGLGFSAEAGADSSSGASSVATTITGYNASVEALAAQIAFNIPGLFPLPGDNLIEADIPFARTSVTNGPVITAQGTPYWPGDILGNFGSLISLFVPQAPPLPNDPLQAESQYPPSPSHGENASFGGTPPSGVPFAPNVFSATSHAGQDGANVTATLADLQLGPTSSPSSSMVHLGPSLGSVLGPVVGAAAGPAVDIGQIQSTNQVTLGDSSVTGLATTVLKAVDIAGVLDISQITSNAGSQSNGNQGTPNASLHLVDVTVDGQQAYIDDQGVHVSGKTTAPDGVTPQEAQNALDTTFAQDGISVRLLDPKTTTNGAEAVADSGGLVVSLTHQFAVPYVTGSPTVPFPGLGNVGLPAGVYTATTSVTLGAATSDVTAAVAPDLGSTSGLGISAGGSGIGLGVGSLGGTLGTTTGGLSSVPGSVSTTSPAGGSQALGARASSTFPLGIPVPLGWIIVALLMCVIFSYPMLLAVRWQFLSGRGR